MASPRALIAPPAFTPHAYGLLTVAADVTATAPAHWEAGVTWQPLCAAAGVTFDECLVVTGVGVVPEPAEKAATFTSHRRAATPFTVYARKDCAAPTFWNQAAGEVSEGLTEGEGWQVERAFWTGGAGGASGVVHPHLAANAELISFSDTLQTAATVITGVALDLVEGLGRLEWALGDCYQGQGVIHIPAVLGPQLANNLLAIPRGGRLYTPNGNLIALGAGYPGTGPTGASITGAVWIYATGAVFYARSPLRAIDSTASLDRSTNTLEQLAERTYVLGWDCCHLAIPISIGGEAGGAYNSAGPAT